MLFVNSENSKLIASFVCLNRVVQLLTVSFLSVFCCSFFCLLLWIQVITKWIHKSGCFLGSRSKARDDDLFAFTLFRLLKNGKRKRLLSPLHKYAVCSCANAAFFFLIVCWKRILATVVTYFDPSHIVCFCWNAWKKWNHLIFRPQGMTRCGWQFDSQRCFICNQIKINVINRSGFSMFAQKFYGAH